MTSIGVSFLRHYSSLFNHLDRRVIPTGMRRVPQNKDAKATQFSGQSKPSSQPSWRQKLVYLSPLTTLLGGMFLLASAAMPNQANTQTGSSQSETTMVLTERETSPTTPTPSQSERNLKEVFSRLGWVSVTAGSLAGTVTGMAAGVRQKQPSMTLGSLLQTLTLPLLIIDPTVPVRAAFFAAAALFTSGLSNKIKNEYALDDHTQQSFREWDMMPLLQSKALDDVVGTDASIKDWLTYLKETCQFVVDDQKNVIMTSGAMAKKLVTHPTQPITNARKFLQDWQKTDNKIEALPKPNHGLMKLGAMLTYAGSVPILFLSGRSDLIAQVGSALIASGTLTNNSTLFMLGASQSGLHHKTLTVGIPLNVAGTAFMANDTGMGISLLGGAGIANYFAHLAKQTEANQKEMPLDTDTIDNAPV